MNVDKKQKNAGFTLVELLIAVTILALVAVPFMHAVISSAKTNARAKKISEATTLAQNTLEELQAEDMNAILASGDCTIEKRVDEKGREYEVALYPCGERTEDKRSAEITVNGMTYEVMAEFCKDVDPDNPEDDVTVYNQKELPQIYDMNEKMDAFYIQETTLDEKMAEKFSGAKDVVKKGMKREITVHITGDEKEEMVEAGIAYTWRGETKQAFPQTTQCIYRNTSGDRNLRNVYLFFQPLTYDSSSGESRETITVSNEREVPEDNQNPVNVYLICQKTSDELVNLCPVNINVSEPGREDVTYLADPTDVESKLLVYTSIRTNLFKEEGENQINLQYGTDGSFKTSKTIHVNGTEKTYPASELTDISSLLAKRSGTRIYKVTVNVYEKGKNSALASIQGAKEE